MTRRTWVFVTALLAVMWLGTPGHGQESPGGAVRLLARWGQGSVGGPSALAVDRRSGEVYVLEDGLPTVRKFSAAGRLVATWDLSDRQILPSAGIAVDGTGYVYLSDTRNNHIHKFAPTGDWLTSWGATGTADGEFRAPTGLAVEGDEVHVIDTGNGRLQTFTTAGSFQSKVEGLGKEEGIAAGPDGALYWVGTNRIQKLDRTRTVVKTWDFTSYDQERGQYLGVVRSRPSGIAVDPTGTLYTTDTLNHRVLKLDPEGRLLRVWGFKHVAAGGFLFSGFAGIAVDTAGKVVVADSLNYRVQRFSPEGGLLDQWPEFAGQPLLRRPAGIAVSRAGTVYVADNQKHRVARYDTSGRFLGSWGGALAAGMGSSIRRSRWRSTRRETSTLDQAGGEAFKSSTPPGGSWRAGPPGGCGASTNSAASCLSGLRSVRRINSMSVGMPADPARF